jgi:hypothetical protein
MELIAGLMLLLKEDSSETLHSLQFIRMNTPYFLELKWKKIVDFETGLT